MLSYSDIQIVSKENDGTYSLLNKNRVCIIKCRSVLTYY